MKRTARLWLGVSAVAVGLLAMSGAIADSDLTGKAAPDLVGRDLNGKVWKLSELRGHPVVLDFWAFW